MKFFILTLSAAIGCFILSGVLFSQTDFGDIKTKMKNGSFNFHIGDLDEDYTFEDKSQSLKVEGLTTIKVETNAAHVTVSRGLSDELVVSSHLPDKEYEEGDLLKVEGPVVSLNLKKNAKSLNYVFGRDKKKKNSKIKIELPKGFVSNLEISMALGTLDMEGLDFSDIEVEMAAGDLNFKSIKAQKLEIEAAAGDINIHQMSVVSASIEAAAGDVDLTSFKSEGEVEIEAAAGDIDVEMNQDAPKVSIDAAAGDIDFSLTEGRTKNFKFQNSTSIGDLSVAEGYTKNEDGDYIFGEGKGSVKIDTNFGDVKVH